MMKSLTYKFILSLSILLISCSNTNSLNIGDKVKDFTLPDTKGKFWKLSSINTKYLLLIFWTQGCVFCKTDQIVEVNEIYRMGEKKGLKVLSVNIGEPLGEVKEFIKQKKLIFPVLLDRNGDVTRKLYKVYVVPTIFLVDRNMIIKEKAYGYITKKDLLKILKPYIS